MTIETGGSAFMDPVSGEYDSISEATELERILNQVVKQVAMDEKGGSIIDLNGNKVGEWKR